MHVDPFPSANKACIIYNMSLIVPTVYNFSIVLYGNFHLVDEGQVSMPTIHTNTPLLTLPNNGLAGYWVRIKQPPPTQKKKTC